MHYPGPKTVEQNILQQIYEISAKLEVIDNSILELQHAIEQLSVIVSKLSKRGVTKDDASV